MTRLDFNKNNDSPLRYAVRNDENKLHDIIYIASYIHEATFKISDVDCLKKILTFNLRRIRWEQLKKSGELIDIPSRLTIKNFTGYTIKINNTLNTEKEMEIKNFCFFNDNIYIQTSFDIYEFIIRIRSRTKIKIEDIP